MIVATPYTSLALVLMLLLLPLDWLFAAVTAGAVHELCHILCVKFCGGTVDSVSFSANGCEICCSALPYWNQILCILAGPLGSLSLMSVSGVFQKIAVCGLIHGVYNLLPVRPLDGGRLLDLVLYRICPSHADGMLKLIQIGTLTGILLLSLAACFLWNLGTEILFCWILLFIKLFPRKTPCKPFKIGVQ